MFAGLRHDAIVRRHYQNDEIDACRAGKHIMNEAFMTGHVNETDNAAARPRPIGEAQIDRNAPRFFFF